MSIARMPRWSGRPEQAELSRLAWALAISLAFHLLVYGCYHADQKYHIWQKLHLPAWLPVPKMLTEALKKKQTPPPPQLQEPPLMFVNVNPAQASAEPPKDAKYYSDKNARAANPAPEKIAETPKIDGKQTQVVKTEDVPREKFTSLQPSRLAVQPQEEQPEIKPKPAQTPGDLTLAKPSSTPRKEEGDAKEAKPPRARTVKDRLAQLGLNQVPGEKFMQEGGVKRRAEMAALDTKATPFGEYDAALIAAISQRWYALLEDRVYASDSRGKVVLQFNLHYDGRVTEMNEAENTAGGVLGLICQKAVLDPAPYAAWPSDMRRTLGEIRHIQFTFYYN